MTNWQVTEIGRTLNRRTTGLATARFLGRLRITLTCLLLFEFSDGGTIRTGPDLLPFLF